MAKNEQKQIIIEAINAIDDEWILNQIAMLIYNITNEKQNGHSADNKAAEIIQCLIG